MHVMHKLITLLVALLVTTANAFATVNVNTANKDELQMLTGIGPAKAQAIIDYRTKNGSFKSVDDLTKVPGIGPAVLGKMKNDVTLTGATTPPAVAASKAGPAPATTAKAEPAKAAAAGSTAAAVKAPAASAPSAAGTPVTPPVKPTSGPADSKKATANSAKKADAMASDTAAAKK